MPQRWAVERTRALPPRVPSLLYTCSVKDDLFPSIDKTKLTVANLSDPPDDLDYWHAQSPEARLRHVEYLRRINYGDRAFARLQRVVEIIQLESQ